MSHQKFDPNHCPACHSAANHVVSQAVARLWARDVVHAYEKTLAQFDVGEVAQ